VPRLNFLEVKTFNGPYVLLIICGI